MRLSKIYPTIRNHIQAHRVSPELLEIEGYVPKDTKILTLPDLASVIFLVMDIISEIVEMFGDWCDESSFLFNGHRLQIDNSYIDIFPFPCYVSNTSFIVHIPYMKMEASLYFSAVLRGIGYSVYSSYELSGSLDFTKFRRVTSGLKI